MDISKIVLVCICVIGSAKLGSLIGEVFVDINKKREGK